MYKLFKINLIILSSLILILLGLFYISKLSTAQTTTINLVGSAWSENIGWISFGGNIVPCTPASPLTRTLQCPTGQIGTTTQTRTSVCAVGASFPITSDWATTSSTCAAPSVYQGIVFGTPTSRTISAGCAQYPTQANGCSSKPYFYCSPWVNNSGVFIDSPSGSTHINYQGSYSNKLDALKASDASLKTCLKSHNYGKLTYQDPLPSTDPEISYYVGTFLNGLYRGNNTFPCTSSDCTNALNTCALGTWGMSFNSNDYWLYKGSLAYRTDMGIPNLYQCNYNGVFEEFRKLTTSFDGVYYYGSSLGMHSDDCTKSGEGYWPQIGECLSVDQQVQMFKVL